MINEPTRITDKSSTLIDLCITNSPANVVNSGVLHLSISDHSLVYMVRKAQYKRNGSRIVEVRSLKNFSRENFLRDLELKQWVMYIVLKIRMRCGLPGKACLWTLLISMRHVDQGVLVKRGPRGLQMI